MEILKSDKPSRIVLVPPLNEIKKMSASNANASSASSPKKEKLSCLNLRVGILGGTGPVGQEVARAARAAGFNSLKISSRDPKTVDTSKLKAKDVEISTIDDVVKWSEVLFLAFGGEAVSEAVKRLPKEAHGKIIIDLTNPLTFDPVSKEIAWTPPKPGYALALETQASLGGNKKVVKAFNSFGIENLATPSTSRIVFYAGDDAESKKVVGEMIEAFGFAKHDLGSLKAHAATLENLATMWVQISMSTKKRDWVFGMV